MQPGQVHLKPVVQCGQMFMSKAKLPGAFATVWRVCRETMYSAARFASVLGSLANSGIGSSRLVGDVTIHDHHDHGHTTRAIWRHHHKGLSQACTTGCLRREAGGAIKRTLNTLGLMQGCPATLQMQSLASLLARLTDGFAWKLGSCPATPPFLLSRMMASHASLAR